MFDVGAAPGVSYEISAVEMEALKHLPIRTILLLPLLLTSPSYQALASPLLCFAFERIWRNLIDPVNTSRLTPPMGRSVGMGRGEAQGLCCETKSTAVTYIHMKLIATQPLWNCPMCKSHFCLCDDHIPLVLVIIHSDVGSENPSLWKSLNMLSFFN